jgi:protein-S-isoprenylcysteine O-methyltransferase Ste14
MPNLARVTTAIAIAMAGIVIAILGVIALRRAKTTVSPLKPEATSSIVTSGVYGFTRNPMYLGLALALLAWAVFVSSAWALLGPVAFVLYMNRFQIIPEERAPFDPVRYLLLRVSSQGTQVAMRPTLKLPSPHHRDAIDLEQRCE